MNKYNPTKFDHEKNSVTIGKKNNKLVLHGIQEGGSLNMISGSSMARVLKKGQALIAHLFIVQVDTSSVQEVESEKVQSVLE